MVTMSSKKNKPLSQQIRDAIDATGRPRKRICEEISLPESTMSHFMAGHCGLSLKTVDRLGELLGLKILVEVPSSKKKER